MNIRYPLRGSLSNTYHLFIYPDKWLNNYPATNKPQKEQS